MRYDPKFFADPFGGKGTLMAESPTKREWICEVEPGKHQICVVENVDPLLEQNERLRSHNAGKKWGDGRIAASIPASIFYRGDFSKAWQANDQKWINKFLNDSDNKKLRTFEGKI
jgi:hypothetical protein